MSPKESRDGMSDYIQKEYPSIIRFIRRKWRGEESADDVLNDVVEKIYRQAEFTVPLDALASYLYRSIRNRIIDLIRGEHPSPMSLDSEEEDGLSLKSLLQDVRYNPEKQLEEAELKRQLEGALAGLNQAERAVVVETEFHDIPFRILSEDWNIPMGTLLSRKKRALQKMKRYLESVYKEESNET